MIEVSDELWIEVRVAAARLNVGVSEFVSDVLTERVSRPTQHATSPTV